MTVNTKLKNGLGQIEETLRSIIQLISDKKGEKTVILDMREFPLPTDFFVIAEGDNPKHVKAIAENILENVQKPILQSEGWESKSWIVLDFGEIMVHVFQRDLRRFYDLEGLWGDTEVRLNDVTSGELVK